MNRALFVVVAGLIGVLLGVGLSLAADAIAGGHLSEPVPLLIQSDATRSPTPGASATEDRDGSNHHARSEHRGSASTATATASGTAAFATPTISPSASQEAVGHDSGLDDGSSGRDD